MDLGVIKFRRSGTNWLSHAINNLRGLIWTDGQKVFITNDWAGDAEQRGSFNNITLVGEFKYLDSVGWSSSTSESPMITVIHRTDTHNPATLAVWRIDSPLGTEPISLTTVLELTLSVSPLSQGFLWDSSEDNLIVPCKKFAHIYKFTPESQSGQGDWLSKNAVLPIPSWCRSVFNSACCATVGNTVKLYLAIETHVLVYNLESVFEDLPSPVLTLDVSYVRVMAELKDVIVCTSELPLLNVVSETTSHHLTSPMDVLTNVANLVKIEETSSTVSLVSKSEGSVIFRFEVEGILSPDLLACKAISGHFVVGSTCHRMLQVFTLAGRKAVKLKDHVLSSNERPKGVAFYNNKLVLACSIEDSSCQDSVLPVGEMIETDFIVKTLPVNQTPKTLNVDSVYLEGSSSDEKRGNSSDHRVLTRSQTEVTENKITRTRVPIGKIQQSSLNAFMDNSNMFTDELIQNLTDKLKVYLRRMSSPHIEERASPETPGVLRRISPQIEDRSSPDTPGVLHIVDRCVTETRLIDLVEPVTSDDSASCSPSRHALVQTSRDPPVKTVAPSSTQRHFVRTASYDHVSLYPHLKLAEWVFVHYHVHDWNSPVVTERIMLEPGGKLQLVALQSIFKLTNIRIKTDESYCHIPMTSHGFIPVVFQHGQDIHITGSKQ